MSSHILQEIEATVDRIIIIDQGEIVADGSTKNLIKKHKGNIQLSLQIKGATKEKIKDLKNQIDHIKINKITRSKLGHHVNIEYSEKYDPREEIFKLIIKSNWIILEMNPKSDNLEDIFRKLTVKKY